MARAGQPSRASIEGAWQDYFRRSKNDGAEMKKRPPPEDFGRATSPLPSVEIKHTYVGTEPGDK